MLSLSFTNHHDKRLSRSPAPNLLAQTRFRYVSLSNFTFILQLTSQEEFWAWTHTELLPTLFPSSWYNGADRQPDGFLADHYSQLVGGARMRLLRAKTGTFQDATELNIVFRGMLKNVTARNRGKLLLVPSRVGMEFPFVSAFVLQMSLVDPRYDKWRHDDLRHPECIELQDDIRRIASNTG